MIGTILGILKLIGILLLALLGIFLTIILLLLFVPVRYRVKVAIQEKPRGMGEVSWFFHLISCRIVYEEELDMAVRILGIRVGGNRGSEDGMYASEREPETEEWGLPEREPETEEWGSPEREPEIEERILPEPEGSGMPEDELEGEETPSPKKDSERKTKKSYRSFRSRFQWKRIWKKIRVTFQKICDKLKIMMDRQQQLLEFLRKEENKRTFRNLKSQLLALFRHIRPRKLTGWLRFGFDDPFKTGQILTYVSPFYGLYAKHFELIPVFEGEAMEGELDIKGRIRLAALIWIGIKVIRDGNFRTLLKKWNAG